MRNLLSLSYKKLRNISLEKSFYLTLKNKNKLFRKKYILLFYGIPYAILYGCGTKKIPFLTRAI